MEVGMKKHLDLGCGLKPRNPYGAELTFGCDIRDIDGAIEPSDRLLIVQDN